jgi:transmembrane sensor
MSTRSNIAEHLALAEASAWLVRLQPGSRTPAYEAAFRVWLAEDPMHAQAFARVTETWDIIPGAARPAAARATRPSRQPRFMAMAASLAFLIATVTAVLFALYGNVYQTQVGEQQTVVLEDGSRITLNTDTRLSVDYRQNLRSIRLDHGEALFEVAKNPQRPFVVQAGNERVRALGTIFMVRNEPDRLDVLLIEGRVQVTQSADARKDVPATPPVVLEPGERLVQRNDEAAPILDRPPVEEATAWRRGEAMFDNATLAEAVAEINRYGKAQVRADDPHVAALRISGVFATRDPVEFANVIAKLHGLQVVRTKNGVALRAGEHMH